MTKSTETPKSEKAEPTSEDRTLAEKAIRGLYGCGIPESQSRIAKLDGSVITRIAKEEKDGRRDRIPAILARVPAKR